MSLVTKNNTFSSGATIIASEHNDNFDTIYNAFNGNISNANISASAAIAYSKLNLTGTLLNADVATDASIAASKLNLASPNQIGSTTPSKGTFTNLTADTDFTVSTGVTVTAILDQDDMHGDSATALATQQSIKAYADSLKNIIIVEDQTFSIAIGSSGSDTEDNIIDTGTNWLDKNIVVDGVFDFRIDSGSHGTRFTNDFITTFAEAYPTTGADHTATAIQQRYRFTWIGSTTPLKIFDASNGNEYETSLLVNGSGQLVFRLYVNAGGATVRTNKSRIDYVEIKKIP